MKEREVNELYGRGTRKKSKNNFYKLLRSNSVFNRLSLKMIDISYSLEAIVLKKITCD